VSESLEAFRRFVAPETPLAAAQAAWASAVGAQVAAVTRVVSEQDGVLTVECESSVWSQELDLMEPRLREALSRQMGGEGPTSIRFRAVL
jgi:predicted nucleic acid-binding Zn ribbon protein